MFPVHNHNANVDNNSLGGGANKSPTINNTSNNINGFNLADVTHKLHVTTYFSPTYCNYCSQFLMGLMKQGLKCESKFYAKEFAWFRHICMSKKANEFRRINSVFVYFSELKKNIFFSLFSEFSQKMHSRDA
jgi:hypothetical protein